MRNLKNARLSTEQIQDLNNKINEVREVIPFLTSLTKSDRIRKQNMGVTGLAQGKSSFKTAKTFSQVMSKEFDTEDFENDINVHEDLQPLYQNIESLLNQLGDTLASFGQNIMIRSNDVYAAIKRAAKKETKYRGAYEELRTYYKRSKSKKSTMTQNNQP